MRIDVNLHGDKSAEREYEIRGTHYTVDNTGETDFMVLTIGDRFGQVKLFMNSGDTLDRLILELESLRRQFIDANE